MYRVVETVTECRHFTAQEKQGALVDAKAKLAEVEAKMAESKEQYDEKLAQKEELKKKAELMLE